jgi:glycine cleavage system regulatory protein
MSDVATQLPPADELADVREKLRALQTREAELRVMMLTDPSARTGNAFAVEIRVVTQERTDLKEMRACHPDIVEQFTFPFEVKRVVLSAISEDGELIPNGRKNEAMQH